MGKKGHLALQKGHLIFGVGWKWPTKWPTKGVLVDLLEEYLGMKADLWSEFLITFLKSFVMFVNKEVCEIVLKCLFLNCSKWQY